MKNILNITNGDSAVEIMKKAHIPGDFLSWSDVLHDGPVPKGLSLDKLSQLRAEFIVSRKWGTREAVKASFTQRDKILKSFRGYEKVILWFEHDLYDQLQVLQILDWFNERCTSSTPGCTSSTPDDKDCNLSMICTDKYLGLLSSNEMKGMPKFEEPIKKEHLFLATKAWMAFRSDSPEKWSELRYIDTSVLPFLDGAIIRMLEEYPNTLNGLSRTAQQALKIISEGEISPGRVFKLILESEERMFLGDASFWIILQELLDSTPALLKPTTKGKLRFPAAKDQELRITQAGLDVLSGRRNWLDVKKIDTWIGGVHLNPTHIWCWDSDSQTIVKKV